MPDDNSETVSWWTSEGWRRLPPPAEYAAYTSAGAEGAPKAFGYIQLAKFGDSDGETAVEVTISTVAEDVHLFVEIWTYDSLLAAVFVAKAHREPFIVDKLPSLLRDFGIADYPSDLSRIRNAITAFIRHGHGERTIDEYGFVSLDEGRRQDDRFRKSRAAKAAETVSKTAPGGAAS